MCITFKILMIKSTTKLRVRYAETDQMGFVYYGNYAQYFEVARVEMLRELGFSYNSLEKSGILLPVLDFRIRYKQPALYDDLLTIETVISEIPSTRITFDYAIFNSSGVELNEASTTLVFVNKKTGRTTRIPDDLLSVMRTYFD